MEGGGRKSHSASRKSQCERAAFRRASLPGCRWRSRHLLTFFSFSRRRTFGATTLMHGMLTASTIFWFTPVAAGALANVWLVALAMCFAAYYHPWLVVSGPGGAGTITVPPAGHVAGAYARTDVERGVWKAPAGPWNSRVGGADNELGSGVEIRQRAPPVAIHRASARARASVGRVRTKRRRIVGSCPEREIEDFLSTQRPPHRGCQRRAVTSG